MDKGWISIVAGGSKKTLRCDRCKTMLMVDMPIFDKSTTKLIKEFIDYHKNCEVQNEPQLASQKREA